MYLQCTTRTYISNGQVVSSLIWPSSGYKARVGTTSFKQEHESVEHGKQPNESKDDKRWVNLLDEEPAAVGKEILFDHSALHVRVIGYNFTYIHYTVQLLVFENTVQWN